MNEISVVVKQEPGKVSWNFEEIKQVLEDGLEVYRTTAYTDATIKTAKSDVATLRKLSAAIKERQKEVKDKCLEPYAIIESQAKELIALIEKPINAINDQVQDYERRRKEAARKEIMDYWNKRQSLFRRISGKRPGSLSMMNGGKMPRPLRKVGGRVSRTASRRYWMKSPQSNLLPANLKRICWQSIKLTSLCRKPLQR